MWCLPCLRSIDGQRLTALLSNEGLQSDMHARPCHFVGDELVGKSSNIFTQHIRVHTHNEERFHTVKPLKLVFFLFFFFFDRKIAIYGKTSDVQFFFRMR